MATTYKRRTRSIQPRRGGYSTAPAHSKYRRPWHLLTDEEREGIRRAQQHIREAEQFHSETRGVIELIQEYLYDLDDERHEAFLAAYRAKYGDQAADYARETIGSWASGAVRMSGTVAKRMFDLIPQFMEPRERIDLVEHLWLRFRPRHEAWFQWGPGVNAEDLMSRVRDYIDAHTATHEIPKSMRARFDWLSRGDAAVQQELLKHYTRLEHDRGREAIAQAQAILSRSLNPVQHDPREAQQNTEVGRSRHAQPASDRNGSAGVTISIKQTIEVGGLRLHIESGSHLPSTIYLASRRPPTQHKRGPRISAESDDSEGLGCAMAAGAAIGLLILAAITG